MLQLLAAAALAVALSREAALRLQFAQQHQARRQRVLIFRFSLLMQLAMLRHLWTP